jgi:glycosyltransferase involved in cell wall biosynthesis
MEASLYIPCYNSAKTIGYCLEGVLKQTFPLKEIVLVDDCSTDETVKIISRYPVKLIKLPVNLGLAAARNTAIKNINSEFIASLDADCIPDKDWLKNIMVCFKIRKTAGVGGRLIESGTGLLDIWRAVHLKQSWGEKKIDNPEFLFGSNTVFRRDVLLAEGLYNEEFKTNYEDVDISLRVKGKGHTLIYEPKAFVYHAKISTLSTLFNTFWKWNLQYYKNKGVYANFEGLCSKIKDNVGLSNKFVEKDIKADKDYLIYLDFLLSSALMLDDIIYFYYHQNSVNGNYNRKLISFIHLSELLMSLNPRSKGFKTDLGPAYVAGGVICIQILLIAVALQEKFLNKDFIEIWLRDILAFYFEDNDVTIFFNMFMKLINIFAQNSRALKRDIDFGQTNSKLFSAYLDTFDSTLANDKISAVAESSFQYLQRSI